MTYGFTNIISVRNVNQALRTGLLALGARGHSEESRNGPVLVAPNPVTTIYVKPRERVLFSPMRDANPFFHFMEGLWMLAGRNDLPWLAQFNKRMAEYSDDGGKTQPAAYGFRWKNYFGYDQLIAIVDELKHNPMTRRCVLGMWNPAETRQIDGEFGEYTARSDLEAAIENSKDVPCNTHAYFRIVDGKLDMTVLCRSNDIWWGAYGANAVHFSMLLEYMAAGVGVPVGRMYQFSNNYHLYPAIITGSMQEIAMDAAASDRYDSALHKAWLEPMPMVVDFDRWNHELRDFMASTEDQNLTYEEPMFQHVAVPMYRAWLAHKEKDYRAAEELARSIYASDWRHACCTWLERREIKYRERGR